MMKAKQVMKTLFFMVVVMSALSMTSCTGKDKAVVNVEVKTLGLIPASGVTVYMYDSDYDEGFTDKIYAKESVVTDENGIANFGLKSIDFFLDDRVTLYFITFNTKNEVNGKAAVTVKKGEEKNITINQF